MVWGGVAVAQGLRVTLENAPRSIPVSLGTMYTTENHFGGAQLSGRCFHRTEQSVPVRGVIIPKRQPNLFHRLSCGFPVSIGAIQPVEPGSHCLPNSRLARGTTLREDPEPPPQIATALAIVSSNIRTA